MKTLLLRCDLKLMAVLFHCVTQKVSQPSASAVPVNLSLVKRRHGHVCFIAQIHCNVLKHL